MSGYGSTEQSDLVNAVLSDADRKLDAVYRDHVHKNTGQNLHAGIADYDLWQGYWQHLVTYPSRVYNDPSGVVGKHLIMTLTDTLNGVVDRK